MASTKKKDKRSQLKWFQGDRSKGPRKDRIRAKMRRWSNE